MQQGWEECSQKHCGVPYWLPGAAIAQPPDQNRRVTEFPVPQRHYFNGKRWTGSHTYLLASPRTGQGERCVFGSLWLSLNVTSFVQQHFYHSYMPSGSSQDQRGKTWGGNEVCLLNPLKSYKIFTLDSSVVYKILKGSWCLPFLSRCSILAPRAMRTDTSSSCPPAHASVSAVSWLLSVWGRKKGHFWAE